MKILIEPARHWTSKTSGPVTVHFSGNPTAAHAVAAAFEHAGSDGAADAAMTTPGLYAAIAETDESIFATVDHCRSIPLFYVPGHAVSNDAPALRAACGLSDTDTESALEIAMAGYASGRHTLIRNLHQLRAGENLTIDKRDGIVRTNRYYTYLPDSTPRCDRENLIREWGHVLDAVFRRVIEEAAGRVIWLPLSGGYDSRLIAAKLVALGATNVQTFSYGAANNQDAGLAATVARKLGLPWRFVKTSRADMRAFFADIETRDRFWDFSGQLGSVPNMQDLLPFQALMARGEVKPGDVVVNGQTGDFISGGHIPRALLEAGADTDTAVAAVIDKHFSLWRSLKTDENLAHIRARIREDLDLDGGGAHTTPAALFERQEYQGRQAKFIVNGQRVYDFLSLDWRLPFWERDVVEFWRNVDSSLKSGQALFRDYLTKWDFRGVFSEIPRQRWSWPGAMMAILLVSRAIRLTAGRNARDRFLKRALYFGDYRHLYAPYRLRDYLRNADDLRNPVSFHALSWLNQQGIRPATFGLEVAL